MYVLRGVCFLLQSIFFRGVFCHLMFDVFNDVWFVVFDVWFEECLFCAVLDLCCSLLSVVLNWFIECVMFMLLELALGFLVVGLVFFCVVACFSCGVFCCSCFWLFGLLRPGL